MRTSYPPVTVISSSAGYETGGLGKHFAEILREAAGQGGATEYFTCGPLANGVDAGGTLVASDPPPWRSRFTHWRWRPDLVQHAVFDRFDRHVCHMLPFEVSRMIGFVDQSLHTFRAARRLGAKELVLHAPTAHLEHVAERHAAAAWRGPIERDWLSKAHVQKGTCEYSEADRIAVASSYSRQSFVARGTSPQKLVLHRIWPDRRFFANSTPDRPPGRFRIVYVGYLSVVKGIVDLLEAVRRLDYSDLTLTLVGHTGSPGMRRLVDRARLADPRVSISPGDPLPHLERADLYVHPSYQDGCGRAPLEALAARVPVLVSEDVGMKDYVQEGVNGWTLPSGNVAAWAEAIAHARRVRVVPGPLSDELPAALRWGERDGRVDGRSC